MENLDLLNYDLQLSPTSQTFLSETAKWGKFIAIIGFIGCGFIIIIAFFIPSIYSSLSTLQGVPSQLASGSTIGITIGYILISALLFFPCLFLYRFSTKMKVALKTVSQENFDASFKNLKSMFKFYGIFTIVMLSIYALVFIFAMLALAMR
ncbi:MAG: hypothetical protein KGM16_08940 [Bacteroidota bacterium]|nr:hypothetical protein [Bacteroidota bacterium]